MRRQVTVTVADSHAGNLADLVARLELAGLEVEQVLTAAGVITGSVEESQLAEIAGLPGVAAVEEQTRFQLPPPDAGVQ